MRLKNDPMVITPQIFFPNSSIEDELEEKRRELEILEDELFQRELDLAIIQGELIAFERRYMRNVGSLQAKFDELEVQIADLLTTIYPYDSQLHNQAYQKRAFAWRSAKCIGLGEASSPNIDIPFIGTQEKFEPSIGLRQAYREIAKRIHPDLASDEGERALRTKLMIEANIAFQEKDESRLHNILESWENNPQNLKSENVQMRLERLLLRISQVHDRLNNLQIEYKRFVTSDLYQIKLQVEQFAEQGVDLLDAMRQRLQTKINRNEQYLQELHTLQENLW